MSLEVHKIRLADGKPSCYYSAHLESPSVNDGFKVFLNPNTRLLISVHEVKDNKSHGFSVRWNIYNKPVSLSFYVKNTLAYTYVLEQENWVRGRLTINNDVLIKWNENIVNKRARLLPDQSGKMLLSIDKTPLHPAIKSIKEMVYKEAEALKLRANAVLLFE